LFSLVKGHIVHVGTEQPPDMMMTFLRPATVPFGSRITSKPTNRGSAGFACIPDVRSRKDSSPIRLRRSFTDVGESDACSGMRSPLCLLPRSGPWG